MDKLISRRTFSAWLSVSVPWTATTARGLSEAAQQLRRFRRLRCERATQQATDSVQMKHAEMYLVYRLVICVLQ